MNESRLLVDGEPVAPSAAPPWALQGASIFTTLRVEAGQPLHWDRHLARLARTARDLGFAFPGEAALARDLAALAGAGSRLLLRLTLTEGPRLAGVRPFEPPPSSLYERGAQAVVSRQRVHPDLARYKTGSHLPYHLARREAEAQGAFEGLLLDGANHLVDGSRTSPVLLQGDRLIVLEGGLDGITREVVAEEAQATGLRIERLSLRIDQLEGELLLAGTGVGLLPTAEPSAAARALIARFLPISSSEGSGSCQAQSG